MTSTTPPKKILFVITKSNWGGAQRYVYDMAVAAARAGMEASVALGGNGPLAAKLRESGIPIFPIDSLGRDISLTRDTRSFSALTEIIRKVQPDVLHLNSSKIGGLGALAGRRCGVRNIIFTAHGWAFNECRPWWQKLVIRALAYTTVALSHRTIAVSNAMYRNTWYMLGVRKKIVIIPNGINPPHFLPRADARIALLPNLPHSYTTWIGTIAELHPTKCIDMAIEAFALFAKKFPQTALVVIGEGEKRKELEAQIAKHDLQDRIFLVGHKHEAARLLKAFDIFTLPSRSEGLAYVLIEAGFAELPVVATRVGGIPEIIEHQRTGLLVRPRDPQDLAEKLQTLIEQPRTRATLAHNLHQKVTAQFSLRHMVEKTLAVYIK